MFDLLHHSGIHELAQSRDSSLLHRVSTIEHGLLQGSTLIHFRHDAFPDRLPYCRDTNHDGRLERTNIAQTIPHGLVGKGSYTAISEGHSDEEQ